MAEWFKAAVLKTAVGVSLPWVRIPLSPPEKQNAPSGAFCFSSGDDGDGNPLVRRIRRERSRTAAGWPRSAQREGGGSWMSRTITLIMLPCPRISGSAPLSSGHAHSGRGIRRASRVRPGCVSRSGEGAARSGVASGDRSRPGLGSSGFQLHPVPLHCETRGGGQAILTRRVRFLADVRTRPH